MAIAGVALLALASLVPVPGLASPTRDTGDGPAAARVPLQRFRGLRALFVVVRLDIETRLGMAGTTEAVLGTAEERDRLLEAVGPERRDEVAVTHALAVGRWAEFERVAAAVLRPGESVRLRYRDVLAAFAADVPLLVAAESTAPVRDRLVESLAILGYRPTLIAGVVGGRIPIEALEQAVRMRQLGHTEGEIERYLETQAEARVRPRTALVTPPVTPAPRVTPAPPANSTVLMNPSSPTNPSPALAVTVPPASPAPPRAEDFARLVPPSVTPRRERFEPAVLRSAARHRVDPDLVRAVIRHESDWNPIARSQKGAVGLMQLMPETARLLGVDPLDPEQNIDGGTRYLASLLALFEGNLDAAIVGYIGGPSYARSWLRGHLTPSLEVLVYLQNIKTSYRGFR